MKPCYILGHRWLHILHGRENIEARGYPMFPVELPADRLIAGETPMDQAFGPDKG